MNIKEKLSNLWGRFWKGIIILVLGGGAIVLAAGVLAPPSIIAEGEVLEFPYTDENINEDFIIRTDQEEYNPLWAWNGFDIYVMVKNESGKTQQVSVSPFFSKDFTIESIAILDETAYTDITVSYDCSVFPTTSTCYRTESVLGKWNNIPNPTFFSEEDYQQFISDNNISVKDKGGRKAKQKFGALFLENKTVYFKVRLKANESFSIEEFDLEIIGDKGGYGLLDPTIFTDDFNSYDDGDLNTQGSWVAHSNWDVQGTETKEGAKAIKDATEHTSSNNVVEKSGSQIATGRITFYFMVEGSGNHYISVGLYQNQGGGGFAGALRSGSFDFHNGTDWVIGKSYSLNVWHYGQIEWRVSDNKARLSIDGDWTDWDVTQAAKSYFDWVHFNGYTIASNQTIYIDYIAEDPIEEEGKGYIRINKGNIKIDKGRLKIN